MFEAWRMLLLHKLVIAMLVSEKLSKLGNPWFSVTNWFILVEYQSTLDVFLCPEILRHTQMVVGN